MYIIAFESSQWDEVYTDLLITKKGKLRLKGGIQYLLQSMGKVNVNRQASILQQIKRENTQNHIKKAVDMGIEKREAMKNWTQSFPL